MWGLTLKKIIAVGVGAILCLGSFLLWTGSSSDTYTIADSTGDWGYPTPYGMYPRGPGYVRMSLIFDTLVWKDRDGLKPALATGWEYIEDRNAWKFTLRKGVTWHDGARLTAEDVAFTFRYIQDHPWVWADASLIDRVEGVNEREVRIFLARPYAPFLTNIAGSVPILPRHIWNSVDDPEQFRGQKALVGSGPYRLADYNKARGAYLYEAYEDYYLGKPGVKRLKFVKLSQEIAPVALRQGDVNASRVPTETVEGLKQAGMEVEKQPPQWAAKLLINYHKTPLSSKKFRHAMACAIDRQQIVDIILRGHGIPGSPGLIPPSNEFWHNPDAEGETHNPDRARKLLEDLGYERGPDGFYRKDGRELSFNILCSSQTTREFGRLAELLKQQFEKVGIRLNVRAQESKTLDARVNGWDFELAISGHGGLGGDPEILKKMILGKSFNSVRYRENEELVRLLKGQIREMDRQERQAKVYRIQEIYAEEMPAVTLYHPRWYWVHDGSVDLYHSPGGMAIGIPLPLNKLSFVQPKAR